GSWRTRSSVSAPRSRPRAPRCGPRAGRVGGGARGEGGEELGARAQLRDLEPGAAAPASGLVEGVAEPHDLAAVRQLAHGVRDPLDVADHGDGRGAHGDGVISEGAPNGGRTAGTATEASARWRVSRVATIGRPTATARPVSGCTGSVPR